MITLVGIVWFTTGLIGAISINKISAPLNKKEKLYLEIVILLFGFIGLILAASLILLTRIK